MGTSKGSSGPGSGLVPSFVNDPVAPALPVAPVTPPAMPASPVAPNNPAPLPVPAGPAPAPSRPDTSGAGDFRGARTSFSRFARTGSRSSLGSAVSN